MGVEKREGNRLLREVSAVQEAARGLPDQQGTVARGSSHAFLEASGRPGPCRIGRGRGCHLLRHILTLEPGATREGGAGNTEALQHPASLQASGIRGKHFN